jgi:hypothetical protein
VSSGASGPISTQSKTLFEIGQSHQDDGQEGSAVPGVIEQDVQMVERVLVKQVGFVDDQDG